MRAKNRTVGKRVRRMVEERERCDKRVWIRPMLIGQLLLRKSIFSR